MSASNTSESTSPAAKMEQHLISTYGLLLTREHLADVLKRKVSGLNWELAKADSSLRQVLEPATLRLGRRTFYRAHDLAVILGGKLPYNA